ncbi:hypothetical protein LguiA_019461 [Lonicera macranthoides]
MEAPTNDPIIGNVAVASLAGAGAGASTSATAAHTEAAATRVTQTIFFISILIEEGAEEPVLSRLERLDNILKQLEDIKGSGRNRTPRSSCASTATSGTLTSDGHASSLEFSPESLEKHCRPIDDVIVETELKGTLIERLVHVEERVLKLGLELERELEVEKKREEEILASTPEKEKKKKGLKQLMKSCVKGGKRKARTG